MLICNQNILICNQYIHICNQVILICNQNIHICNQILIVINIFLFVINIILFVINCYVRAWVNKAQITIVKNKNFIKPICPMYFYKLYIYPFYIFCTSSIKPGSEKQSSLEEDLSRYTLLYAESISAWSNQGSVLCLLSILNQ